MIHPLFLFLVAFLFDASITCTGIVVNLFAQDLGASAFQLGVMGFSWGCAYCVVTLLLSRFMDKLPRRALAGMGITLFAASVSLNLLVHRPTTLIWICLLTGFSCGLFWPTFETFLHVHEDGRQTARNMGVFNIGWAMGIAAGVGGGGFMKVWGTHKAFPLLVGVSLLALGLFLLASRKGIPAAPHAQDLKSQMKADNGLMSRREVGFLKMSWIGNFCMWYSGAALSTLFPKLARSLHIPDQHIGLLLSVITAAQCLTFLALSRSQRWHYRMLPSQVFQLLPVAGLALLVVTRLPVLFAASMALVGIGRGMTYSASLYYGLAATKGGGSSTGFHEFLIGLAFVWGPLISGLAAQEYSLRTPFAICMVVVLVGMASQVVIWQSLRKDLQPSRI